MGFQKNLFILNGKKLKDYNLGKELNVFAGIEAVQIAGICRVDKKILEDI